MNNKAFTLSEVLIVLVIIGILTAILMPVAFQSAPDKNIMKFQKAYSSFTSSIKELVNSDDYFLNGDLGMKKDGTLDQSGRYFCESLAEVMNIKSKICVPDENIIMCGADATNDKDNLDDYKKLLDLRCLEYLRFYFDGGAIATGETWNELKLIDDVIIYTAHSGFGCLVDTFGLVETHRAYSAPNGKIMFPDENGFDPYYRVMCIDVDGYPKDPRNHGENLEPFAIGVRADGKILLGKRAEEWVNKSIQKK